MVTKGKIFFRTALFFFKADFNLRGDFFYEIVRVTSSAKAVFEVVDVFIEGFSRGVSSQESNGFALYETFSDLVRVTGREMRVLQSLCRFKNMCRCQGFLGFLACVARVSSRGSSRKLGQEQKKNMNDGGGGGEPFFLLSL